MYKNCLCKADKVVCHCINAAGGHFCEDLKADIQQVDGSILLDLPCRCTTRTTCFALQVLSRAERVSDGSTRARIVVAYIATSKSNASIYTV